MTKETNQEERCYYIYRHLKGEDGSGDVFYIGRGKRCSNPHCYSAEYKRAFSKQSRTDYWRSIVKKYGYTVEVMVDDLTYEECLEKERELIKLYGRKDQGGLLANFSDGGEGNTNYVPTAETIQKYKDALTMTLQDCIDEYVFPEPNTGCWLWAGTFCPRTNSAKVCYSLKNRQARRAIYEYLNNCELPRKQVVVSTCGCDYCVNPDHTVIMSTAEAANKRAEDGKTSRGSNRWNSKFTEEDVIYIKKSKAEGRTNVALAKEFGVSRQAIGLIDRGINWAWLHG